MHPLRVPMATLAIAIGLLSPASFLQAQDAKSLLAQTAAVREMTEEAVITFVPEQSGLQYVACPNCTAGHQERQLVWSLDKPDEVHCQYCQHRFPSDKYPMNKAEVVHTPRGETARFEYWENDKGYRYFFKARRDDEVKRFLSHQTLLLARLYEATKDKAHARRAAVLLDRFAQVFPSWCYHYDYPFQQKVIYDGDVSPADFRRGFRTARWNWWAYSDIPEDLLFAHRILKASGVYDELAKERNVDVSRRIETDLLRNAGEQVLANKDELTNMSPYAWTDLVELGETINQPGYAHEVVRRLKQLMNTQFFYDGFWCEGSPSYGQQTVNALGNVLKTLRGYSDPPGYIDPIDRTRFDKLDLEADFPILRHSRDVQATFKFPNGRLVPVHDTWAYSERGKPVPTAKSYLLPALGHTALMVGNKEDRTEFHLTWSGGYGHQHADVLSLLLFANGAEGLSDVGYTHSAYRSWTLATAAHNTVVIDGRGQDMGSKGSPTDGRLRFIDMRDPRVQVVSVDGERAYPGLAKRYRRTMVIVDAGGGHSYAVDLFEVAGGSTHDYFLHGNADVPATASTELQLKPLATLLPDGFEWKPTTNEGEAGKASAPNYAYGFLTSLRSGAVEAGQSVKVDFRAGSSGVTVTLVPESKGQLVLGENPSIRNAKDDDAKLKDFNRPFLMLRQTPEKGWSRFVSVIEPHDGKPAITSARAWPAETGSTAVEVKHGDRIDLIVLGGDQAQVHLDGISYLGEIGLLRRRGNEPEFAYSLGVGGWKGKDWDTTAPVQSRVRTDLLGVDGDSLIVGEIGVSPAVGEVIRVETADGWTYPYHVKEVRRDAMGLRLTVAEGPGLELDGDRSKLTLTAFPQRTHPGKAFVEWMRSSTKVFEKK